tara:strand:- start:25 stop:195 length:171 start_codon:yes stop_codon:yes gene_type:complete
MSNRAATKNREVALVVLEADFRMRPPSNRHQIILYECLNSKEGNDYEQRGKQWGEE